MLEREVCKKEMEVHRIRSVDWNPTAVVALATSVDGSHVAAARTDGSLEIWLVPPGSVGWHCQLTIHGEPKPVDPISGKPQSRVSSLLWCQSEPRDGPLGRLFSSNIDGSIAEWDLYNLREKTVLDSIGISIWQIAVEPRKDLELNTKKENNSYENGNVSTSNTSDIDEENTSESEDEDSSRTAIQVHDQLDDNNTRLALACGDGCVRIYSVTDDDKLTYNRTLPRVSGRTLSVTWSTVRNRIYSGSSDGFIRCWDVGSGHEIYRITVGHGGLGSGSELCIWSLLGLSCGTIVSGDSSGRVQFWDSQFGTLLQAHAYHKGHVNALATSPSQSRVFSTGSDGKVILYKRSSESVPATDGNVVSESISKWIYIDSVRYHTHDVLALAIAVPISREDLPPDEKVKRRRGPKKPFGFSYLKWAHLGVPMLISGGVDTKLFAYSVNEFTNFHPHDICPAPQRLPMQLVPKPLFDETPLLLVQGADQLDIYHVYLKHGVHGSPGPSGWFASTKVARVDRDASRKIICSAISSCGTSFAYSDHVKPHLYERKRSKLGEGSVRVRKRRLPQELPFAHFMIYSSDSSRLLLAGHDQRIYVLDVGSVEVVHIFTPCRNDGFENLPPSEPPITKMMTSTDGQWLAAVNCFGDIYVFGLETLRQHWFISRLNGASVTAGGFTPRNPNILVICTSSNQVYCLDVDAKLLGEWSKLNTASLPKRFQEFPGEVIGLSFQPTFTSTSVIVYSTRATCFIDLGMPVDKDDKIDMAYDLVSVKKKFPSNGVPKRKRDELKKNSGGKNFELCLHKHPIFFVGHLSDNSLLVVDKPWSRVVNAIDTKPVHKHIYGT